MYFFAPKKKYDRKKKDKKKNKKTGLVFILIDSIIKGRERKFLLLFFIE